MFVIHTTWQVQSSLGFIINLVAACCCRWRGSLLTGKPPVTHPLVASNTPHHASCYIAGQPDACWFKLICCNQHQMISVEEQQLDMTS